MANQLTEDKNKKDQLLSKKFAKLLAVKTESHVPSTDMVLGMMVNLNKEGKLQKNGHYFSQMATALSS